MPLFRKRPIVIEAFQWFKNGDHPLDSQPKWYEPLLSVPRLPEDDRALKHEGSLVRYFRRPDMPGICICGWCNHTMHDHGFIDTPEGGHTVCPGDWIITGIAGEHYPCKPKIFEATYSPEGIADDPGIAELFRDRLVQKVTQAIAYATKLEKRVAECGYPSASSFIRDARALLKEVEVST